MKKLLRIIPLLLLATLFTATSVRPVEAKCVTCAHKKAKAKGRKAKAKAKRARAKARRLAKKNAAAAAAAKATAGSKSATPNTTIGGTGKRSVKP